MLAASKEAVKMPDRECRSTVAAGPMSSEPNDDPSLAYDLCALSGGDVVVGTDGAWIPEDGEGPARRVEIAPFRIARRVVTVEAFARFVDATGYTTDAERIGWSFVFAGEVDRGARVI